MKRFVVGVFGVAIFFVGLGALVDKAGARFKSDEKALELIRKARQAIGGDNAIAGVKSLRIVGQTTRSFKIDGVDRSETGETEIALQLPDKLMKMVKIGHDDGTGTGETSMTKQLDVVVVDNDKDGAGSGSGTGEGRRKIVINNGDGSTQEINGPDGSKVIVRKVDGGNVEFKVKADNEGGAGADDEKQVFVRRAGGPGGEAHHEAMRHNEMLRLTLGLLMTAPEGLDVSYTYGGDGDVDGTPCSIVVADFAGSSFKIYLGKSNDLPVMMTYTGMRMPMMVRFRHDGPKPGDDTKDTVVLTRKIEGPMPDTVEFSVKFSDYRSVGGVQLPYKWVQTVGGNADETFDVTNYEVNPANIADKFQNQKVMIRTKKPDSQ